MEVDEILLHIFGKNFPFPEQSTLCDTSTGTVRQSSYLENVNLWVTAILDDLSKSPLQTEDFQEGRIGPDQVRFDITTHVGLFVLGADRLSVNSQSNFSTIRGNACIFKGKWQYEVQLGSKGVMQIGWATSNCKFSQEIGVGDTINSYAYDGDRVRKWNISTYKYGEPWIGGDVIGSTIDLNSGILEFFRNGRSLGIAFENLQMGPGIAYFPAVSLAFAENLVANFGSTPMRFPVPGFKPIQDAPLVELAQAGQLFKWLAQLLYLFERKAEIVNQHSGLEDIASVEALLMSYTRVLFFYLGPLFMSPYITEASLVPFLEIICQSTTSKATKSKATPLSSKKPKLMILLDMMWLFLEDHEVRACMEYLVNCLLSGFRQVPSGLDYPHQKESLVLLTNIVQHSQTRQYLLEQVLFEKIRFASFVYMKSLDEEGLKEVVSHPWWDTNETDRALEGNKVEYFEACKRIQDAIANIEALQVNLLKILLDNSDGSPTCPSSRKIFLRKFRAFLYDSILSNRSLPFLQPSLPISLCCFHRLLVTFRLLWEQEVGEYPITIPTRIFYDGSVNYFGIDRMGGVLSHVKKVLREDLVRVLGDEHPSLSVEAASTSAQPGENRAAAVNSPAYVAGPSFNIGNRLIDSQAGFFIPALTRMLAQQHNANPLWMEQMMSEIHAKDDGRRLTVAGTIESVASLVELLDGLILFYHTSAHRHITKVSKLRENMVLYMDELADTRLRLETYVRHNSSSIVSMKIIRELETSCEVFHGKLCEQARHMAWVRSSVYSPENQSHLAWLLRVLLQTIKLSSQEGQLFSFLPDFYLESLVEICAALRTHMHPTVPFENVEGYEELLVEVAEFLCNHFADPRIVHANSKDTMIQALASFVCRPNTLIALERVPYSSRLNMVTSLLRPYENRAWAQSNWVLVRIWQGCGFAFRFQKSPHLARKLGPKLLQADSGLISQAIKPCPSLLYQNHLKEVMLTNESLTTPFLNSLLNQLNWAFSEFIGMLQEIQNISNRRERILIESRQLKICATCFDLALSLLRVLEMMTTIAREIFTDSRRPSSDLLLARLCQLLCQVLNRVSSQSGCFQHVVLLEIPDLETVDHFPVLSAVVGILLALLGDEIKPTSALMETVPKVSKALLTEPSFQLSSLHFVVGDLQNPSRNRHIKTFTFRNYADDVSSEEIALVQTMIESLENYQSHLSEARIMSEEETCTICYAYPISAKFKPCNHESCSSCIAHHLMNSRACFFCKTPIETVESLDGAVLHVVNTCEPRTT